MDVDIEKLQYVWSFLENWICQEIDNVLADSETDPHHSAITASNLIICYIEISKQLGTKLPYDNVKSFLEFNAYTSAERDLFEKHKIRESKYYKGVQY